MPEVSKRALAMPASPIRRLVPYAEAAVAKGIKIHHLNIGQPDVESPEGFWQAVEHSGLKVLEYSHSAGIAPLRSKMSEYYKGIGIDVAPDQITVTTAGSEALIFALQACLNPGEQVIVPEPMYANYISFAGMSDVQVVPIQTRIEENFALPPTEEFAKRITEKTKAILVCNPGNPTGTIYSNQQMAELAELAVKNNLFVISDEVYRDFNYTGQPIKSILQLPGMDKHGVMIDSASKRYSLCGARVGFLVSRNPDVNSSVLKYAQARLSPPTLEQVGLLGALETPPSYYEAVREEFQSRRDLLVSRLRAMNGVVCPEIEGAFYAMVRLPVDDVDTFARWLLEEFNLNGETVMFAPGSGFYSTPGGGKDEARIAYVLNREKLGRAMDCLQAGLSVYPGRTVEQAVGAHSR